MTQQQLIALILSAPFAVALTSIIRRLSERADGTPRIDGPPLVWGVAISLSVIGNVLLVLTTGGNGAAYAWGVGIGLCSGIMGCGLVQTHQSAAAKGATQRTIAVTPLDVIPPAPKVPIIRDTTPTAPPGT